MMLAIILLGSYVCPSKSQPPHPKFLIRSPPILLDSTASSYFRCPSRATIDNKDKERRKTREILNSNYRLRPFNCGGPGWTRVAYLNMTDPRQKCPHNWNLRTGSNIRGCGRVHKHAYICESVIFPANGVIYSRVCGRIIAYQAGSPDAFYNSIGAGYSSIDQGYVDGISVTHGRNPRKHIWTFAAALSEAHSNLPWICKCTNTGNVWPYEIPGFIGNNTFCDTGNKGQAETSSFIFESDPLWDGDGCGRHSSCCQENRPPWFCTSLPHATSDDIELRLCLGETFYDEDILVSLVEIYVQ